MISSFIARLPPKSGVIFLIDTKDMAWLGVARALSQSLSGIGIGGLFMGESSSFGGLFLLLSFGLFGRKAMIRIFGASLSSVLKFILEDPLRIERLVFIRKDFENFNLNNITFNWKACTS